MIKLNENSLMGKAYMLDKYDNLIEVKYHPYGYEGDIEENSSCAYFLYKYGSNKNKAKVENMLFQYLLYCFVNSEEDIWELDNIKVSDNPMFKKLFKAIFNEFDMYSTLAATISVDKETVLDELYSIFLKCKGDFDILMVSDIDNYSNVDVDNIEAYMALNEDFVRVRVGGRYDNDKEDCIYFRISSIGYDWGDNIMDIVFNKFKDKVNYITIERDMESAKLNKANHKIYKTKDGQPINHLPIKDFIYQEHIPLVASIKNKNFEMLPLLESGHSMLEMRKYIPKAVMLQEYSEIIRQQINSFRQHKSSNS